MNIQPIWDRVVLKWLQEDSMTKSGIYLPDWANKERPFVYEVLAVGPWKWELDMSHVSIWDKVLCGQYAGDEVTVDDESYKVVAIEYILAKII